MFNLIYSESPFHYRSRWRSIRVLYFTIFLSAVGFSIVMPSVWPFLKIVSFSESSWKTLVTGSDVPRIFEGGISPNCFYHYFLLNNSAQHWTKTGEFCELLKKWRNLRWACPSHPLSTLLTTGQAASSPAFALTRFQLDPAAQTTFLGLVIGAFSLGQLAASPVIGALINAFGRTGPPLMICLSVQILGNLMWSQLQDLPHANGYFMLFSRILIGTGAANMAAIRAYVSKATTLRERTKANAFVSTCQALGFIIGPGLQAAMVPLGFPGSINLRGFRINVYTTPGWLGALFGECPMRGIRSSSACVLCFHHRCMACCHEKPNFQVLSISWPSCPYFGSTL